MLAKPNRARPCRLDLANEIYSLKSYGSLKDFSFNLLRDGNIVSSRGKIGLPSEMGFREFDQPYMEYMLQHPVKFWEYCRILDMLPNISKLRILDIGGGSSPISFYLAAQGAIVDVIDYEMVAGKNSIIENSNLIAKRYNWSLLAKHGSAVNLPFDQDAFDCVISVSTLEHVGPLRKQKEAFKEVSRVLKPGGMYAITFDYGNIRGIRGHHPVRDSRSISLLVNSAPFEIIGNADFEDLDYVSHDIAAWDNKNKHFEWEHLRWLRWYTAFSLFLKKPFLK